MAGYSGTPLPKKLGIKENFNVLLLDIPADVKAELRDALAACKIAKDVRAPLDFAMIFVKETAALKKKFSEVAKRLTPAGMIWVSWPKKTAGVATDVTENDVRRIGLQAGLVDVKVCAVNEVWSGLKFVIRVKDRPSLVVKSAKP
jgi:Protein of unknown function (DUF3052)